MDLNRLPLEIVDIINKVTPNDDEIKKFQQFANDKKDPSSLAENDKFMYEVCKYDNFGVLLINFFIS